MTEKITDSEQSRRTFVKGTVAAGAGVAGLASLGTAAAQDTSIIEETVTAVQQGEGLVLVQLQVTDAVDVGSVKVTIANNEVIKNVGNNNRIAVPVQVSGNQVGVQVAIAILGEAENVLDQTTTTVTRQVTRQA